MKKVKGGENDENKIDCTKDQYKQYPECVEKVEGKKEDKKYEEYCKKDPHYIGCPLSTLHECKDNPDGSEKCKELKNKIKKCISVPGNLNNSCSFVDNIYKNAMLKCNLTPIGGLIFPYGCWYSHNKKVYNRFYKLFE